MYYRPGGNTIWSVQMMPKWRFLVLLCVLCLLLSSCASIRTLSLNRPGYPLVYSGARLDWYAMQGGCCPQERFGVEPPEQPSLDLPGSILLDTLLLPFTLAASLGVQLGVKGGM